MERNLIETAYHEAGHVVADYVQGFGHGGPSIEWNSEEGVEGYARGETEWADGSRDKEAIISLLAGLAAARLIVPDQTVDGGGATSDYERANELLQFVSADLATLESSAADLIREHRTKVDAIAELLLEEKTVDEEDLELICIAIEEGNEWREELDKFRRWRQCRPS